MLSELRYRVTVDNVIRFEERADVGLFAALATGIDESDSSDAKVVDVVKKVFKNSLCLAAFIYECGLTERDRAKVSFSDWVKTIDFVDLMSQYDKCIEALFLSSPSQKTTTETGETEAKTVAEQIVQEADAEETAVPA